jgi:hypothetical protein
MHLVNRSDDASNICSDANPSRAPRGQ